MYAMIFTRFANCIALLCIHCSHIPRHNSQCCALKYTAKLGIRSAGRQGYESSQLTSGVLIYKPHPQAHPSFSMLLKRSGSLGTRLPIYHTRKVLLAQVRQRISSCKHTHYRIFKTMVIAADLILMCGMGVTCVLVCLYM